MKANNIRAQPREEKKAERARERWRERKGTLGDRKTKETCLMDEKR